MGLKLNLMTNFFTETKQNKDDLTTQHINQTVKDCGITSIALDGLYGEAGAR